MATAISVSGLHKSFGRTHALDGLDLTVNTGEVHGVRVDGDRVRCEVDTSAIQPHTTAD
ncbi:hypothetical protein GTS_46850 [Gandjariella thermophila]|uniref:Transport-associated OB type 2 domain-containing protein n=1 Tax=Gandjariella thermophila TaxID=1931992 RepID=A0A4D4JCF8_9PSEU|nr:hypothetical protein GTS_46850 [Gandjariella thermophila]